MKSQPTASARDWGGLLRQRRDEIIREWESQVRRELPAAREQDRPALIDNLPLFLEEVASALDRGDPAAAPQEVLRASVLHAEQRSQIRSYTLDQVIREYQVLRWIIVDVLRRADSPTESFFRILHTAVDFAVRESASHFTRMHAARLHHLQRITDVALTHLSLDDLLRELLDRIADALDVDTAAVLLAEGDAVYVRAAKGLDEEAEQRVRVPVGQGFAGRIAATRRPLALENVDPAELYSPNLRRKGLRSMLGAPLQVHGELIGVIHVGTTAPRRFSEEDMHLLQLVADRVALGIDRARLYQQVQEADQRKSEFVAMVSHELRTPLSAVSNALYILENIEIPDERGVRQLIAAHRQTRQLSRLVDDLMDISRIAAGKIDLRTEKVALCRIARSAAESVRPLIEGRGQVFNCTLTPEPVIVEADPARLEQIISNLLGNAMKFTEPGGEVHLTVEREGDRAVIRVRDTGVGIDPPTLPHIWDMFSQVGAAQARANTGLGIGLALVKKLVEFHHGAVSASSEGPGKGSEFVVRLPLAAS